MLLNNIYKMKTLGIIGGIGPESTILYYRLVIKKFKEICTTGGNPHIIINSIDNTRLLAYSRNKQYDELTEYLVKEIDKLKQAGVDFAIVAANTPHIVFDKLILRVALPLLSIVEETCKVINAANLTTIGLFGTKYTMEESFYKEAAKKYGIEIIVPGSFQQEYIHDRYINELIPGIINQETKDRLIEIALDLRNKNNITGLILGGTELSLILQQGDFPDLIVFDTTVIHADSAVKYMLS